jgi:hypothetical protein
MVEIEPRFQLCNVRIIFADQKITPTDLQDLGIELTLHFAGWLLSSSLAWGLAQPFLFFSLPSNPKFLRTMLLLSDQVEWESAYSCASETLCTKPKQMSALNAIYHNPEKCGRFYLRRLKANLKMNGDVSAEQNHSGAVA